MYNFKTFCIKSLTGIFILSVTGTPSLTEGIMTDKEISAVKFLDHLDIKLTLKAYKRELAGWNLASNITDANEKEFVSQIFHNKIEA